MDINQHDTALVVTDPQNDVLSAKGVAWGLVEKSVRENKNADDRSTYYGGGAKGYTDYPTLAQERGEQPKACVDESWR